MRPLRSVYGEHQETSEVEIARGGLRGYNAGQQRSAEDVGQARMLQVEVEREEDGRWIAEVPALPGVLAYGATEADARLKALVLALRVMADRIEHGEPVPREASGLLSAA